MDSRPRQNNKERQPSHYKGATRQICGKLNHTAIRCWHRFNHTYQPEVVSQALAAMTLSDSQDSAWFPDTGASAHMTADTGKLQSFARYTGSDKKFVGNGAALDITHIGSASDPYGHNRLELNDVLVVPEIKKSLLSVSQMTTDHPYVFEFSSNGFEIKNRETRRVIAAGSRCGGLYAFNQIPNN